MKPPVLPILPGRLKLLRISVVFLAIGIALYVFSLWIPLFIPGPIALRSTTITFLSVLIAVYSFIPAGAIVGLAFSAWAMAQSPSRGHDQPPTQRHQRAARCLLVSGSIPAGSFDR